MYSFLCSVWTGQNHSSWYCNNSELYLYGVCTDRVIPLPTQITNYSTRRRHCALNLNIIILYIASQLCHQEISHYCHHAQSSRPSLGCWLLMTKLGDRESEIQMIITRGKGEVSEMGWKVSEWTYLKRWLTDIRTSWVLEGGSWHPGNLLSILTTTLLQHWLVVKQGVMCLICCAGVLVRIRTTRLQTATALGWPLTTTPLNPTLNRGFVFSTCQQKQR